MYHINAENFNFKPQGSQSTDTFITETIIRKETSRHLLPDLIIDERYLQRDIAKVNVTSFSLDNLREYYKIKNETNA